MLNDFSQITQVEDILRQKNIPFTSEAIAPTEWGYRGYHITFKNADGISAEIQLTRPDVWAVKLESDKIYERWRNVEFATADAKTQMAYLADRDKSLKMWDQIDLPDFAMYSSNSLSDNTRALYNSSPYNGNRAGIQAPSENSNMPLPSRMGDVSNNLPDSVKHAINSPPDNNIMQQKFENINLKEDTHNGMKIRGLVNTIIQFYV